MGSPTQALPPGGLASAFQDSANQVMSQQPQPAQAPVPAQQPAPQQQQPYASPPSPRPILLDLIKGLIHPQAVQTSNNRPASRTDVLEGFLGNFMQALGSGFANEGRGPGAALRGAGAAMGAPYQQSVERFGMQQQATAQQAQVESEQAKTALTGAQTQQMGQMVTLPNGMTVPFALAQKIAPALFSAQGRVDAAQLGKEGRVEAATIGQGMLADVPPELQEKFGLPAKLPLKQLNAAESAANRPLTITQGADGPSIVNKLTGKSKGLGLGAPAGGRFVPIVDPATGLQTYRSAAQAAAQGSLAPGSNIGKVFTFKARMDDMDRVIGSMDSSLDALKQNDVQRGLMAKAFQAAESDPNAMSTIVNSELFKQMTPKSQDFVVNNLAARENMQAAAQMLSQSGLSDARTRAVLNTLPVASDPFDMATRKMIQVKGMLGNLKESMPQVKAIEQAQKAAQAKAGTDSRKGNKVLDPLGIR